ncbi:MAG: hypothetical protein WC935_00530 [Thermoleophilia bacterium]
MQYRPPKKRLAYGELINDSFRIAWRHKMLWFFGLFAGGMTSFNSPNYSSSFDSSNNNYRSTGNFDTGFSDWVSAHVRLLIIIGVALVAVYILFWLWSIVCRGAVINSVRDLRDGRQISFKTAFAGGRRSFTKLLLFDLFIIFIVIGIMLIFLALGILIFFLAASGSAGVVILSIMGLSLVPLFFVGFGYLSCCSMILFYWAPITLLMNFAQRAVILDDMRPMESLRRAWHLMMDNLGHCLLILLLSLALSTAALFGILLVTAVTAIPAIIAWVITIGHYSLMKIIVASLLTLIPLVVIVIASSAANTYFTTYWTIAYRKLTGQEGDGGIRFPAEGQSPVAPSGNLPYPAPTQGTVIS